MNLTTLELDTIHILLFYKTGAFYTYRPLHGGLLENTPTVPLILKTSSNRKSIFYKLIMNYLDIQSNSSFYNNICDVQA